MYLSKTFTPAAASLTGYASNVTGASWTISTTSSSDSLAHQVTIRNDSVTDHSAKTVILTGTDADGIAQTETMNLPGTSATVTSTKFFKTLLTAVPSATIGADTMDIGWAATSHTQTIGLERFSTVGAAVTIDISGTINFTAYETPSSFIDTPAQNGSWTSITALAAKTADTSGSTTTSMQCFRVGVNSVTAGATMMVVVSHSVGL